MATRRDTGVWVLRAYGIALVLCIVAGFLHGPAMPGNIVLIGRVGAVTLGTPWLVLQVYKLYQRLTIRRTFRRILDARIAEVEDPRTFVPTDAASKAMAKSRMLRKVTSDAGSLGAVMIGDLEGVREHPFKHPAPIYVRVMSLDRGTVVFVWNMVGTSPLLRFHRWLRGKMAEIESRDLYTRLTNGVIIRTTDVARTRLDDGRWLGQHHYAAGTSLREMIEVHRGHVAAALTADPSAGVERHCTIDDAQRLSARIIATWSQHMREVGIFSEAGVIAFCAATKPRIARIFRQELLEARKRAGLEPREGGGEVARPDDEGDGPQDQKQ